MAEFLITGGAGFIGSHIAERLVRDRKLVRVLDDFSSGKESNLEACAGRVEVVRGDLRDKAAVARAVAGVRVIFHLAAIPSVPRSVADPVATHEVNVNGTLNLLMEARAARVGRVVFSSSSAVYGETLELPKRESMTPAPISPYGLHKLMGEQYCRLFWQLYRVETISLRYFNVFGPRQDPGSAYAAAIPKFMTAILAGRAPVVFGDGEQTRDFTYVENVVEANLAAANASSTAVGGVFNIACGQRISINNLIRTIARAAGRDVKPKYDPPRAGDVLHSEADIAQAARLLGFQPPVDLASGLARTLEWFRSQG